VVVKMKYVLCWVETRNVCLVDKKKEKVVVERKDVHCRVGT